MYLSTEELTRLNLINPLKQKLAAGNTALSNLSSNDFMDLPNVVVINGLPALPLEFISQPELIRIGVWDLVKDQAKAVQKSIHSYYAKLAKAKMMNLAEVDDTNMGLIY